MRKTGEKLCIHFASLVWEMLEAAREAVQMKDLLVSRSSLLLSGFGGNEACLLKTCRLVRAAAPLLASCLFFQDNMHSTPSPGKNKKARRERVCPRLTF